MAKSDYDSGIASEKNSWQTCSKTSFFWISIIRLNTLVNFFRASIIGLSIILGQYHKARYGLRPTP